MVVPKKWLEYPSVKKLVTYLAAKNGGLEYVSEKSLLTSYAEPVYYFCKANGFRDPEEAIEMIRKNGAEEYISKFRMYLLERGRAPSSIRRYNNGIKRWLGVNEIQVDWSKINYKLPLPKRKAVVEDRMPRKDELKLLFSAANIKMKAVIEILSASGIRVGSLLGLRYEDLDFDSDDRVVVITVRPENSKSGVGYYTLIHDEAREILEKYLDVKGIDRGWIFPSKNGGPMKYEHMNRAWVNLLKKTGLTMKSRNMYVLHMHTLRKYFRTILDPYLTKSEISYLMGHLNKEYLDGSYFKPIPKDLIERYKAVMHNLYIMKDKAPSAEDIRKKALLDMAKLLGFPDEKIRMLENLLEKKTVDQAIEEIRKFRQF